MKNKKIALIDLDNTVADHESQLQKDLHAVLGTHLPTVPKQVREEVGYLIKNKPGWWLNLKPLDYGLSIVETLRQIGFRLTICSKGPSRSVNAWTEKVQWVQMHIPDADIVLTQDKSIVYGRVLVDDWPDYIKPWLDERPRGIVLMPATPHNKRFKHPRVFRLETYNDLRNVKQILQKVYDRRCKELVVQD